MANPQAATVKKPTELDVAKLQDMVEPITVRVVKVRGTHSQPIDLPPKEGYAISGPGYMRDDVLQLDRVVLDLAGGGYYKGQATDANGTSITWNFGWPPAQYPEKTPPADYLATIGGLPPGAARAAAQATIPGFVPPPAVVQVATPAPFAGHSSWPPPGYAAPVQPPSVAGGIAYPNGYVAPAPQPQVPPGWGMGYLPPGPGTFGGFAPQPDGRAAALADELARERARAVEERHQRELAEQKRQAESKTDALAAQIAELARVISTPRGESDEVKTLREELRLEREKRERAEERAEAQRREEAAERRHREEMAALHAKIDAMVNARPVGPDPMLEYMRESSRNQTETMREVARMGQQQVDKLASQMMNPLALAELLQKAGRGADEAFQGMSRSMLSMLEMHRDAARSVVEMTQSPAEHPAIGIVKDGVQTVKDVATRYIKAKEAEKNAEAQVAAVRANAQAQTSIAAAQIAAQQGQFAGAPQQQIAPPQGAPPQVEVAQPAPEAPPPAEPVQAAAPEPAKSIVIPAGIKPSEAEMFGNNDMVLANVQRLRLGVRQGLDADKTVEALIQGIAVVRTMDLQVPAFALYEANRQDDFVDVLLPDAPQALKDAVAIQLKAVRDMELTKSSTVDEEEEPEEDEDEAEGEGVEDDRVA